MRGAEAELKAKNATVAAVGTGTAYYAKAFKEDRDLHFPLLIDEKLETYELVGAKAGSLLGLLKPSVVVRAAAAVLKGHPKGKNGPHALQFGATHIIRPDGLVPYAWVNDDYPDHPSVADVLAAL